MAYNHCVYDGVLTDADPDGDVCNGDEVCLPKPRSDPESTHGLG